MGTSGNDLRSLLRGDTEARASIGELMIEVMESAEAEIDGCSGLYDAQDVWERFCTEAGACWSELLALLDDGAPQVRVSGCKAVLALAQAAWHKDYSHRLSAADLRERLMAAAELLPLLDAEAIVRAAALAALRPIDGKSDALAVWTDKAIELLGDASPEVRAQAVRVVAHRFGRYARELLRPLCADEDPLVEEAIVDCLVRLDDEAAGPVLRDGILGYRGRSNASGASDGYVFAIRDWLDNAKTNLVRARPNWA